MCNVSFQWLLLIIGTQIALIPPNNGFRSFSFLFFRYRKRRSHSVLVMGRNTTVLSSFEHGLLYILCIIVLFTQCIRRIGVLVHVRTFSRMAVATYQIDNEHWARGW